ncbi:MAG: tetratricopeptide repeat protein [Deltaproteobacteria bacterium]|nr:tetratricopeptide repeat protein [Deltaproteobacteria bacterium]
MTNLICSMICIFLFSACGPIGAYHHTALDTPSRHVDNGLKFLQINKIDAAVLEFSRAAELDPDYAPAFTGLGLAYGRMGDFVSGYEYIELAAKKARGYEQESAVKDARMQLDTLRIKR